MLAYAANRPTPGKRQSSPHALLVVVSVHVALLAIVMSAKMDLPSRIHDRLTTITLTPEGPPPPPSKLRAQPKIQAPTRTAIDNAKPVVSTSISTSGASEPMTSIDFGKLFGTTEEVGPVDPVRPIAAIRHEARLLTPPSELKPPYPASKLASEEEGVLTLRLSIDARGHVVAVDPVGNSDRAFLESARRYLIAHWKYQPATEGDRPVPSTVTITLHFQLDG